MSRLSLASLLATLLLVTTAAAGAEAPAPSTERLVGVLTKQAQKQCVAGEAEPRWVNPYWEVGFVRVEPTPGVDLAALEGRPVVVEGHSEALAPLPTVAHTGPCMVPQMRDDWQEGPAGMRVRRSFPVLRAPGQGSVPEEPKGLRVTTARGFDGLAARVDGDALEVTVTNPLDQPLAPLAIVVHYEGCYGKPGSTARRHEVATLAPGKSATARFPLLDEDGERGSGGHVHAAYSVELQAPAGPARFDLDVSVRQLTGAAVRCPRD